MGSPCPLLFAPSQAPALRERSAKPPFPAVAGSGFAATVGKAAVRRGSLSTGFQPRDVVGLARVGLGDEPRVEQLARHLGAREPQPHDEDVGVVPFARAGGGGGVRAQRGPNAWHLVGRDRRARARPAEQDSRLSLVLRHQLAHTLADLGPLDRFAAGRPDEHDVVATVLELVADRVGHGRLLVRTQRDPHGPQAKPPPRSPGHGRARQAALDRREFLQRTAQLGAAVLGRSGLAAGADALRSPAGALQSDDFSSMLDDPAKESPIDTVVVVMMENHSFDHTSVLRFLEWRFLGAPARGPGRPGQSWFLTARTSTPGTSAPASPPSASTGT